MKRTELADRLHDKKYNCCQAVLCAWADKTDIDEQTLFRIGEGFGLGMGCMDGTCGALSGAIALAGLANSDGDLDAPKTKASTMKLSREILSRFSERCRSTICRELKGVDTGKMLCSCPDCIRIACEIAGEVLFPDDDGEIQAFTVTP